jgi:hypothetical protein
VRAPKKDHSPTCTEVVEELGGGDGAIVYPRPKCERVGRRRGYRAGNCCGVVLLRAVKVLTLTLTANGTVRNLTDVHRG